jgi:hypothetical protein
LHAHPLDIRIPAAFGDIVGVTDIIAVPWPFSTHFTASGHCRFPHHAMPPVARGVGHTLPFQHADLRYIDFVRGE